MADCGERRSLLSSVPTNLPADFLHDITLGFSDERKIGQGAFGTVYMGNFEDGTCIAVKRLTGEDTYDKKFQNEILNLMAIHHKNIVRIVAYCHEAQKKVVEHNGRYIITEIVERAICYEYLPKGSIDKYIYDNNILDWGTRFEIIKGICQGLEFLHRGMETPMVHMSLHPANIVLDDHNVPKITDFGASRVFNRADQTRMMTQNHVGVLPYMAPEYLYRGEISTQSDIYSLGIIIIEITIAEKNRPETRDMSARSFIDNVRETWTDEKIASTYSSLDTDSLQQVKTCIEIGLKCVDVDRKKRPSTSEIVDRLYGPRAH